MAVSPYWKCPLNGLGLLSAVACFNISPHKGGVHIHLTKVFSYSGCSINGDGFSMEVAGGGGVLPIMDYTGRLRPKGVPFSGWRYIKG